MEALPLRDIHLPEPIGWWPPALGWWIVLMIVVLLIAGLVWFLRRRQRLRIYRFALRELESLQTDLRLTPHEKLQRLSMLLRRVGLSLFPREEVAGLVGENWLHWLDRPFKTPRFAKEVGRLLIDAPYRPPSEIDIDPLVILSREWLRVLPKMKARRPLTSVPAQNEAKP
jgi:hypothetical protein